MPQTRLLHSQFCYYVCLIISHLVQWVLNIREQFENNTNIIFGYAEFHPKETLGELWKPPSTIKTCRNTKGIHPSNTHYPPQVTTDVMKPTIPIWAAMLPLISDNLLLPLLKKTSQAATLPTPSSMSEHRSFSRSILIIILYITQPFNMCQNVLPFLCSSYLLEKRVPLMTVLSVVLQRILSPISSVAFIAWFCIAGWFLGMHDCATAELMVLPIHL